MKFVPVCKQHHLLLFKLFQHLCRVAKNGPDEECDDDDDDDDDNNNNNSDYIQ